MGGGRPYPSPLPDKDNYTVTFDGPDDPDHPHNWPLSKKMIICSVLGFDAICVAMGSAIFASGTYQLMAEFNVASVVITLGTSLYVLGFATGPVVWAPISELYGRKIPLILSGIAFVSFIFGCATAENLQTALICRFFAGCIGSAPLVVVAAAFSDMFNNETRGTAIVFFSMAVCIGPSFAPIFGAYIAESYLGWRWTQYIIGILAAFNLVTLIFFMKETHHPIILIEKAEKLRRRTGNWGIRAAHEDLRLSFKEICEKNITRPLVLLFTEPIILLLSIYTAFIYGVIYMFLTAYPYVFTFKYEMKGGNAYLPMIGLCLGQILGSFFCLFAEKNYLQILKANDGKPVPEARLKPMMFGGITFPIGILWFCWTGNYPDSIHWIVPTISGVLTGFATVTIFMPAINYIIDSYLIFAASALAANTFLRSGFGCAFPLFSGYMFSDLGVNWSGLLLGLFGLLLAPVPFLFYKYGKKIRTKSKYAFDLN
ncbi:polyamine transporter TPO1 [Ascoidea rubescens DSM 1968]|uniref:MFS general substrate transporter n=1 Tax=Ascoidea rubescens DSM 1968 TaxID=1344418 RepID=A0A1D2VFR5_9ASCO|nr:MFS general substrate transporter [Ascoidea rubescens DSM 1968]ODV60514.1 MFS general substrate transporter [Ascoidea rubescens DSM 1968]